MAGRSSSGCSWKVSAAGSLTSWTLHCLEAEANLQLLLRTAPVARPLLCYPSMPCMDAQDAINLTQQAMLTALLLGAPILSAGVLVGLLIGLAQALTQIQDQTVAFVPKIVAMVGVLILCLPWLVQKMVEYSEGLIANIPKTIAGG